MSSNDNKPNQPQTDGLTHDAQGRWCEMLSPTQVLTGQQITTEPMPLKKKCHGNQKLRRYRRKCRARGLTEEEITMRIQNRNHAISEQVQPDPVIPEQTQQDNKRKRDDSTVQSSLQSSMKSLSQLSIIQETRQTTMGQLFTIICKNI
jgi:hypothetical protein